MADLLHDPNSLSAKNKTGVIATFPKMVKVIEFVIERGPAYGYHLNMKKCIYLMAPTAKKLM